MRLASVCAPLPDRIDGGEAAAARAQPAGAPSTSRPISPISAAIQPVRRRKARATVSAVTTRGREGVRHGDCGAPQDLYLPQIAAQAARQSLFGSKASPLVVARPASVTSAGASR